MNSRSPLNSAAHVLGSENRNLKRPIGICEQNSAHNLTRSRSPTVSPLAGPFLPPETRIRNRKWRTQPQARHAGLITFQPAEMLNSPSLSEIPNSAEETAKPSWKRSHRIQQGDQKSVCQIPRHSRRKQTLMKSGRCWFQEAPWRNQKYRLRSFKKGATEF